MKTETVDLLKSTSAAAEKNHRAQLKRIEVAEAALATVERKLQERAPRPKGSPTPQYEIDSIKAEISFATRDAQRAADYLERTKAVLATALQNGDAVERADRAQELALAEDRAQTELFAEFIRALTARQPKLRELVNGALEARARLPAPVVEAVPAPNSTWLATWGEDVPMRLARVARALVSAEPGIVASPPANAARRP